MINNQVADLLKFFRRKLHLKKWSGNEWPSCFITFSCLLCPKFWGALVWSKPKNRSCSRNWLTKDEPKSTRPSVLSVQNQNPVSLLMFCSTRVNVKLQSPGKHTSPSSCWDGQQEKEEWSEGRYDQKGRYEHKNNTRLWNCSLWGLLAVPKEITRP